MILIEKIMFGIYSRSNSKFLISFYNRTDKATHLLHRIHHVKPMRNGSFSHKGNFNFDNEINFEMSIESVVCTISCSLPHLEFLLSIERNVAWRLDKEIHFLKTGVVPSEEKIWNDYSEIRYWVIFVIFNILFYRWSLRKKNVLI